MNLRAGLITAMRLRNYGWLSRLRRCYQTALKLTTTKKNQLAALLNLGALYVDNGLFDGAEAVTKEVLKLDPDAHQGSSESGHVQTRTT